MIADLLPRYYEVHPNPVFTSLRSVTIDEHEIAWMQYHATFPSDDGEGEIVTGNGLYCECDFKEDVGWYVGDGQHHYVTDAPRNCLYKQTALKLRQLELRREYKEKFAEQPWPQSEFSVNLEAVIMDLIKKAEAGEWVGEDGGGASFWGGHFYLQLVSKITECLMETVWKAANKLVADERISFEGSVVCDYHAQPPRLGAAGDDSLGLHMPIPFNNPDGILEGGYRIKAWQPRNDSALPVMHIQIWIEGEEGGEPVATKAITMSHTNIFGLDVEDLAALEEATTLMLSELPVRVAP